MAHPNAAGRVFVIGLDTGDGDLVRAWAAAGHLPQLRRLIDSGAWGRLSTSADTLHVSGWPTLYTGTMPGRHGVYYTHQPCAGEQGAVRFHEGQYGTPTFWRLADAAAKICVVLDAPYTHPVEGCGTTQVFEWGTWAHYLTPCSQPTQRLGELEKACGAYPLGYEANQIGLSALEPRTLVPRLEKAASARAAAARWLLDARNWELAVVVFSETHPAAHYLWPAGLAADGAVASGDTRLEGMLSVYRSTDAAIGELVADLDEADTVLVVSTDGVGPNFGGWHLLPAVLTRLGLLVPPGAPRDDEVSEAESDSEQRSSPNVPDSEQRSSPSVPDSEQRSSPSLYRRLRGLVPDSLRASISRRLPARLRDALMKKNASAQIDWTRTRAYTLPTDLEGCIRINLTGREPEGIVAAGAEYEELCDLITTELEALVDPASGQPAVREVVRVDRNLPGERRDQLPDLVVHWTGEGSLEELTSPKIGTVSGTSPDRRSGTHRAPGFVIAHGPGFTSGSELNEAGVLDLAPTVLECLGVPVPTHMEGRAWKS